MKFWTILPIAVLALAVAACSGGTGDPTPSSPDLDGSGDVAANNDAADVTVPSTDQDQGSVVTNGDGVSTTPDTDTATPDAVDPGEDKDPGPGDTDPGPDDPDVEPTDDGTDPGGATDPGDDVDPGTEVTDDGEGTADVGDAETSTDEDPGPQPDPDPGIDPCACPGNFPVCSIDGIQYPCEQAARCAGLTFDQYSQGSCQQEGCDCTTQEEVEILMCGTDEQDYTSRCEMREAYDCDDFDAIIEDDGVLCLAPCSVCLCDCPTDFDPVCGVDGVTYQNNCNRVLCTADAPDVFCAGACFDFAQPGCAECDQGCDAVCGTDGQTYTNACAAGCVGTDVFHAGACGACGVSEDDQPVCGSDGKTYGNYPELYCATLPNFDRVQVAHDGACSCDQCPVDGNTVCGDDGVSYANECRALQCGDATSVTPGACPCDCANVYDPVCGEDGRSWPSRCLAECSGGTVASEGLCGDCELVTACTAFAPACDEGMTFPSTDHVDHVSCTGGNSDIVRDTKSPCADCEEDRHCNDLDPCTTDTCVEGTCDFEAIDGCTDEPEWGPGPGCN